MRPIKLTMQAFGPFLSETVDFDVFGDNLFLISGPTGSGKTTIFDGICYALYGEASGDDRLPDGMKSDFAPVGTACVVTLVFDVHGKVYRVERLPHQHMYNSHNTGIKEQKHEAALWQIEGDGTEKLLCNSIKDIKNKIHEILGLTASQFRQIVMLPQGRFSRLLKASEKERIDLLKTLFPMTFYEAFEKKLERETKDAENAFQSLSDQIERKRDDFVPEASSPLEKALSENEISVLRLISAAEEQNEKDERIANRIKASIDTEKRNLDTLNMAIGAGEAQITRFDKMNALTVKLDELTSREQEMKSRAEWVDVARRLEKVGPFETLLIKEQKREKNAAGQLAAAETNCQKAQSRWDALQTEIDAVNSNDFKETLEGNRKRIEKIKSRQEDLKELESHAGTLIRLNNETKDLEEKVNSLTAAEKEKHTIADMRIELTETIGKVQRQKNRVDLRRSLLDQTEKAAAAIADDLSRYKKCGQTIGDIQNRMADLRQQVKETKTALAKAKTIDRDNRAAALAAELQEGEPCPVCGSIHHPVIAERTTHDEKAGSVNALTDQLTALTAAYKSAETKAEMTQEEARTYLEHAERELFDARNADDIFAEEVSSNILQYDAAAVKTALEHRRTLLSQESKKIVKTLEDHARQKEAKDSRLAELNQRIASQTDLRSAFESKKDAFNKEKALCHAIAKSMENIGFDVSSTSKMKAVKIDLAEKLSMATREVAEAEERQKQLAEAVTQAKSDLSASQAQQAAAERNLRESSNAVAQAVEVFEHKLQQASLSREQYDANQNIDGETIRKDQKILEAYHQALISTQDTLAALKEELADQTKPDLEALNARKADQLARIDGLTQDLKSAESRLTGNQKTVAELKDLYKGFQEAKNRFGLLNGLNKTVKGTFPGKQKMAFERYILSAYLSDVLERANLFLEMISDGRYRLRLSESTEGRQSRGLAIAVFDEYTGKSRNASSLSGGETFMAALSMALGLSDIVSEGNGALTIETLFIDEGFATLDAEAREKAMSCLARLRRKGRSVGIISHVTELIDLIDQQIIVTKTDEGSHIRLVR